MARRTFNVVDVTEIYVHWYAGRSKSELAASLGVDRKTIRKYLAPAEATGMTPGGTAMAAEDWAALIKVAGRVRDDRAFGARRSVTGHLSGLPDPVPPAVGRPSARG